MATKSRYPKQGDDISQRRSPHDYRVFWVYAKNQAEAERKLEAKLDGAGDIRSMRKGTSRIGSENEYLAQVRMYRRD